MLAVNSLPLKPRADVTGKVHQSLKKDYCPLPHIFFLKKKSLFVQNTKNKSHSYLEAFMTKTNLNLGTIKDLWHNLSNLNRESGGN